MIALVGYQLALYRRSRFLLVPVLAWLVFLIAFYVRVSDPHPGAYGRGSEAVLLLSLGLAWTLCLLQEPALWQILVVSAGSRERAQASRILLCWLMVVPLAGIAALVTASHRLGGSAPAAPLIAGLVFYLIVAALGCGLGVLLGSRSGPRLLGPVCLFVLGCWLVVLS